MITVDSELDTNTVMSFAGSVHAYNDAIQRSQIAHEQHQAFFEDPLHVDRVEKTKAVVKKFFNGARLYVNERGLTGRRPFTVVKVEKPLFPNHLTQQQKEDQLYAPLRALNVKIVFARGSNSYLFRIY